MTDNFPDQEGTVFNPFRNPTTQEVSAALFFCAYQRSDKATEAKVDHPWQSHGNKSEGVDETKGIYRTVFGREELAINTTKFAGGNRSSEAAADYKSGAPCYRHTVYKDGAERMLKFEPDAQGGKMRVADKYGEATLSVYPSGVDFTRTSKDTNQTTKFTAGTYDGKAKLEHRTKGNIVFTWEFDVTNGLTMKNHGALDRPYSATKITTDGYKIEYSLAGDGTPTRSSKTKLTESEKKEVESLFKLLGETTRGRPLGEKMTAPEMLSHLQRWGSYNFLSGEQRDTKKIPSTGQSKSTPLTDGLGALKAKEQTEKKTTTIDSTPERAEDKRVRSASDAILAMEKDDYKYLAVKHYLMETYEKAHGKPNDKMKALKNFVGYVNGNLKGKGSLKVEPLYGKLADVVKEGENAKDADFVLSMKLSYGKKEFGPIAFTLRPKK